VCFVVIEVMFGPDVHILVYIVYELNLFDPISILMGCNQKRFWLLYISILMGSNQKRFWLLHF